MHVILSTILDTAGYSSLLQDGIQLLRRIDAEGVRQGGLV